MPDCTALHTIFFIIFMVGIPFCGFAQLITFGVWYSRIHPYFKNAQGLGEKVYEYVEENLFVSIAIFVAIFFVSIYHILCKNNYLFSSISDSIYIIIGVALGLHAINAFFSNFAFIDQFKVGLIAMKNGKFEDGKCFNYLIDGLKGADEYYANNTKYMKWRSDFIRKAFDSNYNPTNYLCKSVGRPTFAFALITVLCVIGMIVSIVMIMLGCSCSSSSGSDLLTSLL